MEEERKQALQTPQKCRCCHFPKFCKYDFKIGTCDKIYCQLLDHGWYWGSMSLSDACDILIEQEEFAFLVRDSGHMSYVFCVSFRYRGGVVHFRLFVNNNLFSFDNKTFVPPSQIANHYATMKVKPTGLCSKLSKPLNRFARLNTLQKNCRFIIRQLVPENAWNKLPLPPCLISYVSLGKDYD